ncbi:MAG: hypothetical protein ACRDHN_13565 [Thermomicrobiales bacterium]
MATPIVTEPGGGIVDNGDPATLSLTLNTESTIQLADLEPGIERIVPEAVSLTIAPGGGDWAVSCAVAFGTSHTTSAGVESVRLRLSETVDWQTPGDVAIPCASGGNDGAIVRFDISILVPEDATSGVLDLTVTFIVSSI